MRYESYPTSQLTKTEGAPQDTVICTVQQSTVALPVKSLRRFREVKVRHNGIPYVTERRQV